jgi:RNA polymerase sigma factor (sigma-70 family)
MMAQLVELVETAKAGSLDAYEELVRRFQDMAVGYAYAVTGDFHLGEDAAQEAFVQAYRDIGTLREPAAFPSWFRQLVYKQCDRITRRRGLPSVPLEADLASSEPGPDTMLEAREAASRVRASLCGLPDAERQATTMFYIGGYSQQEIGTFLGVSVHTVKNRLRAARATMRQEMVGMVKRNLSKRRPSKDESFAERVVKGLIGYTDREIQIILREVDSRDVAILLGDMDDGVRQRVLANMSKNSSQIFLDEMTLAGRVSKKRMKEVRERVVAVIQRQGEAGTIAWPVPEKAYLGSRRAKWPAGAVQQRSRIRETAQSLVLMAVHPPDLLELVVGMAECARREGILSLEEIAASARDPFLRQAVRLVVDGYESKLARSFLEDMMDAALRHEETLCRMVETWTGSVGREEPPALLEQRLRTMYRPGVPERDTYTKATAGSVRKKLAGRPFSGLELDQAVDVLVEAGILARLKGPGVLVSALKGGEHVLLSHATELLEGHAKPGMIETILSDHQTSLIRRHEVAYRMTLEGLLLTQGGNHPRIIESRMRAIGGL